MAARPTGALSCRTAAHGPPLCARVPTVLLRRSRLTELAASAPTRRTSIAAPLKPQPAHRCSAPSMTTRPKRTSPTPGRSSPSPRRCPRQHLGHRHRLLRRPRTRSPERYRVHGPRKRDAEIHGESLCSHLVGLALPDSERRADRLHEHLEQSPLLDDRGHHELRPVRLGRLGRLRAMGRRGPSRCQRPGLGCPPDVPRARQPAPSLQRHAVQLQRRLLQLPVHDRSDNPPERLSLLRSGLAEHDRPDTIGHPCRAAGRASQALRAWFRRKHILPGV